MGEERGKELHNETDKTIREKQDAVGSKDEWKGERQKQFLHLQPFNSSSIGSSVFLGCSFKSAPMTSPFLLSELELHPRERNEPLGIAARPSFRLAFLQT